MIIGLLATLSPLNCILPIVSFIAELSLSLSSTRIGPALASVLALVIVKPVSAT